MDEINRELQQLKEEIEEGKTERANLDGRREEVQERLKNEFSVKSVDVGRRREKEWGKKLDGLEVSIRKDFQKLKEEYSW